jgi:hypothetical protein
LFVQSDDCKESVNYRNISIVGDDIWIEQSQEINLTCFSFLKNIFLNYQLIYKIFSDKNCHDKK